MIRNFSNQSLVYWSYQIIYSWITDQFERLISFSHTFPKYVCGGIAVIVQYAANNICFIFTQIDFTSICFSFLIFFLSCKKKKKRNMCFQSSAFTARFFYRSVNWWVRTITWDHHQFFLLGIYLIKVHTANGRLPK